MNNFISVSDYIAKNYANLIFILIGALVLTGVILDWDWLCDPSRGGRRFRSRKANRIFIGILGACLLLGGAALLLE